MLNAIKTNDAPSAIGPYSQAIDTGEFVFVSGQLPINPVTEEICEGIEQQTSQVLQNIEGVLKGSGLSLSDAVKFTIFISSMDDFPIVNKIYSKFLNAPYPARSTVEVSRLPKDSRVEMDVIAKKTKGAK